MQIYIERSNSEWEHTAQGSFYICAANADPKSSKKLQPKEFNPWSKLITNRDISGGQNGKGIKLTTDNFAILSGFAQWRKP